MLQVNPFLWDPPSHSGGEASRSLPCASAGSHGSTARTHSAPLTPRALCPHGTNCEQLEIIPASSL